MLKKSYVRTMGCVMSLVFIMGITACGQSRNGTGADANNTAQKTTVPEKSTPVPEKKKESAPLKFLYTWPEHQAVMGKTIKAFEEKNTNVKVEVNVVPWDKINNQLQLSLAANEAPDVSFMWPGSIGKWVPLGAPLDLTSYIEKDPQWKNSFLSENVLNPGTIGGKLYCVPFRGTGTYIVYNKDIFEKNGWSFPENLEAFEKMMDEMMAKKIIPFAIAGKPDGMQLRSVNRYFYDYALLKAGILLDPQYVARRKTDINGQYAQAFTRTKQWLKKGYFSNEPFSISIEEAQSAFANQKGTMLLCNNNELLALRKLAGDKFKLGFADFPAPSDAKEKMSGASGFDGFFAYQKTKYPDEAVSLIKHLTSPQIQSIWAKESLSAMVVKGVAYEDKDLEKMASSLAFAGKYILRPDYNTGDLDKRNDTALVEFLMKDTITPEQLEKQWCENIKKAIADATK